MCVCVCVCVSVYVYVCVCELLKTKHKGGFIYSFYILNTKIKPFVWALDTFGWVWLVWEVDLCLLLQLENAMQQTPPSVHRPRADYDTKHVLNWNYEDRES